MFGCLFFLLKSIFLCYMTQIHLCFCIYNLKAGILLLRETHFMFIVKTINIFVS